MAAATIRDLSIDRQESLLLKVACDPARRVAAYELLGPFCHECRNQLNALKLSIYLARRSAGTWDQASLDEQERLYEEVETQFDRLQQICRPMKLTAVRLPLDLLWDDVFPNWTERLRRHGMALHVRPPRTPVIGDFDPTRVRAAFDALVDWRTRAGRSGRIVRFQWRASNSQFVLDWSEREPAAALERDDSGAAATGGFFLPYVARVLSAHRGTLRYDTRKRFRIRLCWPLDIVDPE